jgi:hypothetical protein
MAKGIFTPKHPEKYLGDVKKICWRSSWELRFMQFCDMNPNILRWASEEFSIPYIKPTDGRVHRYFPDFYIEFRSKDGTICKEVIEIKPHKEAVWAQGSKNKDVYTKLALVINEAKWEAAVKFCEARGLKFRVLTEKSLFKGKGK